MRGAIALLLVCGLPALAQVTPLDTLKSLLIPGREHPLEHPETRGATPAFTVVKHTLRDWIESRLGPLTKTGQEAVLTFADIAHHFGIGGDVAS
jgi:hypothetical protein